MVPSQAAPGAGKVVAHHVEMVCEWGKRLQIDDIEHAGIDWQGSSEQIPRCGELVAAGLQEAQIGATLDPRGRMLPVDWAARLLETGPKVPQLCTVT